MTNYLNFNSKKSAKVQAFIGQVIQFANNYTHINGWNEWKWKWTQKRNPSDWELLIFVVAVAVAVGLFFYRLFVSEIWIRKTIPTPIFISIFNYQIAIICRKHDYIKLKISIFDLKNRIYFFQRHARAQCAYVHTPNEYYYCYYFM